MSFATLQVAYTPDSDDVFNYFAWETGRVALPRGAPKVEFHREHIAELNRAATTERYHVVAVSAVAYPRLASRYQVLSVGNSVGRGWGPVLASLRVHDVASLAGKRVAVAGHPTTGSVLAARYAPGAEFVEIPYDRMVDAIREGVVDAGVMIHEELLHFAECGLHPVLDLGKAWSDDTGLPLPVGLNLVRRDLPEELATSIAKTCRESLQWGFDHPEETYAYASRFGRGKARKHVEMFSNTDTLRLQPDVVRALRVMFDRLESSGLAPHVPSIDVVDAPADRAPRIVMPAEIDEDDVSDGSSVATASL